MPLLAFRAWAGGGGVDHVSFLCRPPGGLPGMQVVAATRWEEGQSLGSWRLGCCQHVGGLAAREQWASHGRVWEGQVGSLQDSRVQGWRLSGRERQCRGRERFCFPCWSLPLSLCPHL